MRGLVWGEDRQLYPILTTPDVLALEIIGTIIRQFERIPDAAFRWSSLSRVSSLQADVQVIAPCCKPVTLLRLSKGWCLGGGASCIELALC